jgi:antitoxin MazE
MYIQEVAMPTVQKWGNSLGIRVPKAVAEQVQLQQGAEFEFDTSHGVLTLRPVRARRRGKYRIAELLAAYKGAYPHRGVFDDPPAGRELL